MIQYWPSPSPRGICTLFVTVAIAPPARAPTVTSPSTRSPGSSSVGLFDRYSREVEAPAAPGASARFLTTWVTLTLAPGASTAGVTVTDWTARSGFTTWIIAVDRTLFASLTSSTSPFGCAPPASARTTRKYVPAEVLDGIGTGVTTEGVLAPAARAVVTRRVASRMSFPASKALFDER